MPTPLPTDPAHHIATTYAGPTNHRGSRVTARCASTRVTVGWDYALNDSANHDAAALALAQRMDWPTDGWLRSIPPGEAGRRGYAYTRAVR